MTDDKLVEAVARAIAKAEGLDADARVMSAPSFYMFGNGGDWNDSYDMGAEWEQWVSQATAAIAAVRQYEGDDGK